MCVYIVQDTYPRHQRLDAAHQWHMGKHITKRRSCWSMEKAVVCIHEGERTSLWTSAKLKLALLKPTHYVTGSFQSHQQSTEENTLFRNLSIAAIYEASFVPVHCRNVNAWNSLPEHVVDCETTDTFKRKLLSTVDLTQFVNFQLFLFFNRGNKNPLRPHSPLAFRLCTFSFMFSHGLLINHLCEMQLQLSRPG